MASAWARVEAAARRAAAAGAAAAASSGNAFFGKVIHRQTGGFTRGQDRLLTATAPGEVVVNAAASRQFGAELRAMNAQQTPQFRETGGAVTNVGDINLNFTEATVDQTTGRNVARDLRREIRTRGTSLS